MPFGDSISVRDGGVVIVRGGFRSRGFGAAGGTFRSRKWSAGGS